MCLRLGFYTDSGYIIRKQQREHVYLFGFPKYDSTRPEKVTYVCTANVFQVARYNMSSVSTRSISEFSSDQIEFHQNTSQV